MKILVDPESSVPIYIQIEDSINSLIAAGQLQPGEQLPTIRELAAEIRVNLNTVARAYFELDRVEEAFSELRSAVRQKDRQLVSLWTDPAWDSIRSDPRFKRILSQTRRPSPRGGRPKGR